MADFIADAFKADNNSVIYTQHSPGAAPVPVIDPVTVMTGKVAGLSSLTLNAFRASMPSGVESVIDELPRTILAGSAGVAMTIRSTSASDVGNVVRVGVLGANFAFAAAFNVTLNGTTPVSLFSGAPITRVNFMARISGDFVGNVLVENAGTTYGFIAAGQQTMRSSQYCVPAGYRLFIGDAMASMARDAGSGVSCPIKMQLKPALSTGFGTLLSFNLRQEGTGSFNVPIKFAQGLTGPIDVRAVGTASSTGVDLQALVSAMLQDLSVTT